MATADSLASRPVRASVLAKLAALVEAGAVPHDPSLDPATRDA
jgi:hypothetical protein